ncbi:hypothetical protein FS749_011400 [Ceratobasidium sp. UAMH 11750]|nr:hypothetical protein FS749_011400 [Ceratobasidium sp. UAMH 11750]
MLQMFIPPVEAVQVAKYPRSPPAEVVHEVVHVAKYPRSGAKLTYYVKYGALCFMVSTAVFGLFYIDKSARFTRLVTFSDLWAREIGYLGLSIISFWLDHVESLAQMCLSILKILLQNRDTIFFFISVFVICRM